MITLMILLIMMMGIVFDLIDLIIRIGLAILPYVLLYQFFRFLFVRRY
ncbi:MAG: hypothetical protein IKS69_08450 [Erysipelotrichaceae bacterium]|nr:hypothetical protein [Erysipelotrichaceae bacterium]